MVPRPVLPVLLLAVGAGSAWAQGGEVTRPPPDRPGAQAPGGKPKTTWPGGRIPAPTYTYGPTGVIERRYHADESKVTERVVPPAEVKALRAADRIPKILGDELFAVTASIRPRRLAPGERGTLHVLVTLRQGSVVPADSRLSVVVETAGLPVRLGRTAIAAPPARVAGRPVYDDVIAASIPVTVRPDAVPDRYPVRGFAELEILDGATGALRGVFFSTMHGWVTVGDSVRRPATRVGGAAAGDAAPAGRAAAPPAAGPEASGPAPPGGDGAGPPPAGGRAVGPPPGDPDGGGSAELPDRVARWLYWFLPGGVLLLLLLVVVLARHRG